GSCGTLTSTRMIGFRSAANDHFAFAQLRRECVLDELALTLDVLRHVADGGRRGHRPAGVRDDLVLARVLAEIRAQTVPRALILRLFLAPHDLGRLRELVELRPEFRMRERVLLLEADDGDVAALVLTPVRGKLVVDLARA